jgi:hypothetical protein
VPSAVFFPPEPLPPFCQEYSTLLSPVPLIWVVRAGLAFTPCAVPTESPDSFRDPAGPPLLAVCEELSISKRILNLYSP